MSLESADNESNEKKETFCYKNLGKSGLKVSNICLGTMIFGDNQFKFPGCTNEEDSHEMLDVFVEAGGNFFGHGRCLWQWSIGKDYWYLVGKNQFKFPGCTNEEDSHEILDAFAESGGNFFDTADIYGNGTSEKIIGTWLAKNQRERYVVATKCRFSPTVLTPDFPNCCGLSRKHIFHSVEKSLQNLQTHYIDLYQMHTWDYNVPIEETLLAFNDLVRSGKILHFGLSNMKGWMLQKIVDTCKYMGFSPVLSLQQQYNLLCRESELEVFDVCKNENVGVLPWGALKSGILTGKYKAGVPLTEDTRLKYYSDKKTVFGDLGVNWDFHKKDENFWKLMEELENIAKVHGKTVSQVSLRWLLQKDVVTSVIIGARNLCQMKDNIGAANGWELSDEEMSRLDAASKFKPIKYPYTFIDVLNKI